MSSNVSSQDVAQWMVEELERVNVLYQDVVVFEIITHFGKEFLYINDRGNNAIKKDVLSAFRKLTGDTVVWERSERCWRKRESYDEPGRLQA